MHKELRDFTQRYSPWARKDAKQRILKISKSDPQSRKELLLKFIAEQEKALQDFTNSLTQRDIKSYSSHHIVHTIPLGPIQRGLTSRNNEVIDTENLSPEESVNKVLSSRLCLSCSMVPKEKPSTQRIEFIGTHPDTSWYGGNWRAEHHSNTFYPFGIVLEEGTILSSYRNDAGTLLEEDTQVRRSKYDKATKLTAIMPDIQNAINNSTDEAPFLDPYCGYTGQSMGWDLNELVVDHAKPKGFYLCLDHESIRPRGPRGDLSRGDFLKEVVSEARQLCSKFPLLPLTLIVDGKTHQLQLRDKEYYSESGESLSEFVDKELEMDKAAHIKMETQDYEDIEARMWAEGAMGNKKEFEYLKVAHDKGQLLAKSFTAKDTLGKSTIERAFETQRAHFLPQYIKDALADFRLSNGQSVGQMFTNKVDPAKEGLKTAKLRGVDVVAFKDGPKEILSHCGKETLYVIGSISKKEGAYYAVDKNGGPFTIPLEWSLDKDLIGYLYQKHKDNNICDPKLDVMRELAGKTSEESLEGVNRGTQGIAKEREDLSTTKSEKPTPDPSHPASKELYTNLILLGPEGLKAFENDTSKIGAGALFSKVFEKLRAIIDPDYQRKSPPKQAKPEKLLKNPLESGLSPSL